MWIVVETIYSTNWFHLVIKKCNFILTSHYHPRPPLKLIMRTIKQIIFQKYRVLNSIWISITKNIHVASENVNWLVVIGWICKYLKEKECNLYRTNYTETTNDEEFFFYYLQFCIVNFEGHLNFLANNRSSILQRWS